MDGPAQLSQIRSRRFAVVFSDLQGHSELSSRTPQEQMAVLISEYKYLAESIAGQFGSVHSNFTGDGHLFLFESSDAAVQFGLKLIDSWRSSSQVVPSARALQRPSLRLGCHFGQCTQLEDAGGWVGMHINLAKRVEGAAQPDSLYVTENVIEMIDLPLYEFEQAGRHSLKGDHLPQRFLYRVTSLNVASLDQRPSAELTAESWFLRAVALIGTPRENSDEEAGCYREALRMRPDYAEAHNNLAILMRARAELADAAAHYQQALSQRPDYPEAHYNYALLLQSRGSMAGAAGHFEQALQLKPDYVDAHHAYANLLKGRGELELAGGHYREALQLRPEAAEVHNNYGILLEGLARPQLAEEHYREALRIRPDYAEAHYNYAILLEDLAQPESAEKHYREALSSWPDYAEAHNNLAVLLQKRGELADAEEHYRQVLRLRPDEPEAHYNYGLLLKVRGNAEAASEQFRLAYELAPEQEQFRSAMEPPA